MLLQLAAVSAMALTLHPNPTASRSVTNVPRSSSADIVMGTAREAFTLKLDLPPRGTCNLKFNPLLDSSEAVVVTYKLPFGLNVENKGGAAVVTKDGDGGEKEGDILRYTTKWELGTPPEGTIAGTIGAFGGLINWQLGLLDVAKASDWNEVVEALTSNTPERTDSVTLVFERPL